MKNRQSTRMFGMTVMGGITVNGPMFDIHDNQHLHFYNHDMKPEVKNQAPKEEAEEETWEMKELKFFDMKRYGSDDKQQQLQYVLRYAAKKIDVNNGRDWFCVYAAERYAKDCLSSKLEYVEFFSDIETLLPGILKKISPSASGYKRYKAYSELLRREAENWFVLNGSLPPINEMVYKIAFGCTEDQFRRYSIIIKDLYRQMIKI